jgi:predicted dehydrogenase
VIVASPDETRAALVLAVIAAGQPVLREKPLAEIGRGSPR